MATSTSRDLPGTREQVWEMLTDAASWGEWWPLGAPELASGSWEANTNLVWTSSPDRPAVTAVLSKVDRPSELEFEFIDGDDGFPRRRNAALYWRLGVYEVGGGISLTCSRLPQSSLRHRKQVERVQNEVADNLAVAVRRRVLPGVELPDMGALIAAEDLDGILAAVSHPASWVRNQAIDALGRGLGDRDDPRVLAAFLGGAADPEARIRRASVWGLANLDDEAAREALGALVEDPEPTVRIAVANWAPHVKATAAALSTRPYTAEERARLQSTPGPRFGEEPTEPFLGSPFLVYVGDFAAFQTSAGYDDRHGTELTRTYALETKLIFPTLCSACLEPTDRSLFDRTHSLSWKRTERVDPSHVQTTTTTVTARFPVPMCERCVAYHLDTRFEVTDETRDLGTQRWVRFRFPNLAYYNEFVEANAGLTEDSIAPSSRRALDLLDPSSMHMSRRDRDRRDRGLEAWRICQDGIGFHAYARLKLALSEAAENTDPETLQALATKYGLSLAQLREIEQVAGTELPALRLLR